MRPVIRKPILIVRKHLRLSAGGIAIHTLKLFLCLVDVFQNVERSRNVYNFVGVYISVLRQPHRKEAFLSVGSKVQAGVMWPLK